MERLSDEKRHVVETLNEIERIENAVAAVVKEQKRLTEALAGLEKAHSEVGTLKPKAAEQDELEIERTKLRESIAASRAVADQANILDQRVARLCVAYKENADQVKQAEATIKQAAEVAPLSQRDTDLLSEIATLNATPIATANFKTRSVTDSARYSPRNA